MHNVLKNLSWFMKYKNIITKWIWAAPSKKKKEQLHWTIHKLHIPCTFFFNPFLRTPLFLFSYLLSFFFKENFLVVYLIYLFNLSKKKTLKKKSYPIKELHKKRKSLIWKCQSWWLKRTNLICFCSKYCRDGQSFN